MLGRGQALLCPAALPACLMMLPLPCPPHTPPELLDLEPLPLSALGNPRYEALYHFTHFNPIQTQARACRLRLWAALGVAGLLRSRSAAPTEVFQRAPAPPPTAVTAVRHCRTSLSAPVHRRPSTRYITPTTRCCWARPRAAARPSAPSCACCACSTRTRGRRHGAPRGPWALGRGAGGAGAAARALRLMPLPPPATSLPTPASPSAPAPCPTGHLHRPAQGAGAGAHQGLGPGLLPRPGQAPGGAHRRLHARHGAGCPSQGCRMRVAGCCLALPAAAAGPATMCAPHRRRALSLPCCLRSAPLPPAPLQQSLLAADVIVCTPEKWDGISRSWQSRSYVRKARGRGEAAAAAAGIAVGRAGRRLRPRGDCLISAAPLALLPAPCVYWTGGPAGH